MRYLVLAADYTGFPLQNEFRGEVDLKSLALPAGFIEELVAWNNAYKEIIPLLEEERKNRFQQIEELDSQGLKFARQLGELVPGGDKVKYFSEGKLQYIFVE